MRYLVFAGSHYYPGGGMNDWEASCETMEDAQETVKHLSPKAYDWYQIFDIEERDFIGGIV